MMRRKGNGKIGNGEFSLDLPALLLGLDAAGRRALRAETARARERWRRAPADPDAAAGFGRALCRQGDFKEGLALLRGAANASPEAVRHRVWCAEAHLLAGQPADALDVLKGEEHGLGLDATLLRSLARRRHGDWAGAWADLNQVRGLDTSLSTAYPLLRALFELEEGRPREALRQLEAAREHSSAWWWAAMRGLARLQCGDSQGSLSDWQIAGRSHPSAWMLQQRARVFDRLGLFQAALRDLRRVISVSPTSVEPRLQAARIHQDQAQYAQAAEHLDRALRMRPGNPVILRAQARLLLMQGEFARAAGVLKSALRSGRGDSECGLEYARCLIYGGSYREAQEVLLPLSRDPATAGGAALLLGVLRCRQSRYSESQAFFVEAQRRCSSEDSERAGFYRIAVRLIAETEGKAPLPAPGRELVMCGLGYRHPYQTAAEVVRVLAGSRVIYSNLSDDRVTDFLGLFAAPLRAVVFRQWRWQATSCARQVFEGLADGGRTAMVTRGNPLFYGRFAWELVSRAERQKVPLRCFGSVSIAEVVTAAAAQKGERTGDTDHLDIVDSAVLMRPEVPRGLRAPTIVYNLPATEGERVRCARRLLRIFGVGAHYWCLAGSGSAEFDPDPVAPAALEDALANAGPALTVYVAGEGR